jgi:hypothetical protein
VLGEAKTMIRLTRLGTGEKLETRKGKEKKLLE